MNFFLLTVLLSLSTMIPRLVPALLVSKIHFSYKGKIFLWLLPYTVMASLVFPGILETDPKHILIGVGGGAIAVLCAYRKMPVIVSVLAAVLLDLLLYLFVY